ncbi:myeloid-associated differentiation marker homolog [Salarias fasciatus]|uniref:Myeloid-associated differentiation marker homolog n=1 Tax=Salarias fasciatus TaxID=181472 RepID=A0A672I7Z5_SALFA|nr:myeloid-associated differentiation marker homolog [Salarias fasciatus]
MPVIVLEARDFISPIFLLRTWEVLSSCVTFSLVASLSAEELSQCPQLNTFRIFCMFIWCFFFTVTLLIHIISFIQFHSLIPISWKNLTVTVAVLGALLSLSASVLFPWLLMNREHVRPRAVAAAVSSALTFLAYALESLVLRTQAQEQRGYMGSMSGLLKVLQLWGGCQMVPLVVELLTGTPTGLKPWPFWVTAASHGVCLLLSLVTVVVIVGDFTGRCFLPFDRFLAGFSLIGVLLCMLATVIGFTNILQLRTQNQLVVMETVVSSVTLLAYTVDFAFSIKLLCDRSQM